jgi:hypothetical protein
MFCIQGSYAQRTRARKVGRAMAVGARWLFPAAMATVITMLPVVAGSQASSPVIQLLLNSRDVRTRVQAATTLGRLRPPGTRLALEAALDDQNAAVRAAAAESLEAIGDVQAVGALRSHASDRDDGVRAGISRALRALEPHATPAPALASALSANAPAALPAADWTRVRYVVRVGNLSNRAGGRASAVDVLRNAILREVARSSEIAPALGALPPDAERRMRSGRLHSYELEGSINTLRRWTVATSTSVRAEVSLVLMYDATRAIVGSLSGAATAQDNTPPMQGDTGFALRLEDRALSAAVRGALANLEQSLSTVRH